MSEELTTAEYEREREEFASELRLSPLKDICSHLRSMREELAYLSSKERATAAHGLREIRSDLLAIFKELQNIRTEIAKPGRALLLLSIAQSIAQVVLLGLILWRVW